MKRIFVEIAIDVPDEDETDLCKLEQFFTEVIEEQTDELIQYVDSWQVDASKF